MTDEDDAQLKSLRTVWLSLPDEDPPERGLADLMAAARVKAEDMAHPSWWQQLLATLRRPPVLALATLLVLIGGVVFVGRRGDKMAVEETVAVESKADHGASAGSATNRPAPTTGEASATEGAERSRTTAPAVSGELAPTADSPTVGGIVPPPTVVAPAEEKLAKPARRAPSKAAPSGKAGPSGMMQTELRDSGDRFAAPADESANAPAPPPKAPNADESALVATPSPKTSNASPSSKAAGAKPVVKSRAADYLAQAKAAAARGDCQAARTALNRLATEDATSYRNAIASDRELGSCVTPTKN